MDVVRCCFRRWYIVIPLLAITAWISHSYYTSIKPVYYCNAVVGFAPPNQVVQFSPDGQPVQRNGLLEVGGADLIMNMAVLGLEDPSVKEKVVAGGGKSNFTVRMFPTPATGNGPQAELPLIMIEAEEADPASATTTVELAASQTDSILQAIQRGAGVADSEMVRAVQASQPTPVAATSGRTKSFLVILMAGIGLAVLSAVGVDALINGLRKLINRQRKRSRERRRSDLTRPDTPDATARQLQSNADVHSSDSPSQDAIVPH